LPAKNYMLQQPDISEGMRQILVDWLIEVHLKFKMKAHTLFISVNLIDRFLSKVLVERNQLQLVGITSLMIAAKYEEIYPPPIGDFVYITDNAYSKSELILKELEILTVLDFNVTFPISYTFLERFLEKLNEDSFTKQYAHFLLDCSLLSMQTLDFKPSTQAAAAIYLTLKVRMRTCKVSSSNFQDSIETLICRELNMPPGSLRSCAEQLFNASNLILSQNL